MNGQSPSTSGTDGADVHYPVEPGRRIGKRLPRHLFHYTNHAGFLGIISSAAMWASDMLFLNDASEMLYGRRLIGEALMRYRPSLATERSIAAAHHAPGALAFTACVLSFSEVGDDLSQWRAYAKDGGYSLGFTARAVRHLAAGTRLRSVIYDRKAQQRVACECAEALRQRVSAIPKRQWTHERLMYEGAHFGILANLASIRLKDPSFAAEREWRAIMLASGTSLRFRVKAKTLVPYREVPFDQIGAVKRGLSVTVGPTDQPTLAMRAAAGLLSMLTGVRSEELFGRRVKASAIPFRDW